jgi:hypothetical protein
MARPVARMARWVGRAIRLRDSGYGIVDGLEG